MIAFDTRYDVRTHVDSSALADKLPEMCGSATLAMEVSRTSMNVASVTVTAITQGLIEPSGVRSLEMNLSITLLKKIALLRNHRGIHIHAGTQHRYVGGNGIKNNFYRDALHH